MGKAELETSLASGGHQRLARMEGEWSGTTRVWFEPDKPPARESPQHGSLRSVLGGRFLLHEYSTSFDGKEQQGIALIGLHLDEGTFECAWIDSFHTGTAIMFSVAEAGDDPFAVLGSYGDGQGGPRWGWRTGIAQADDDTLVVSMFNVTPDGDESKAVETCYRREI